MKTKQERPQRRLLGGESAYYYYYYYYDFSVCHLLTVVGLCPDWESWVPENALPNCTEAMDAAEEWLDVPQVKLQTT